MTSTADRCPVCESSSVELFLERDSVPVHQHLLMRAAADAGNMRRGRLAMTVCHECGFVFNATFDPTLMSYNQDYENTQVHSPAFNTYVNELVDAVFAESGIAGGTIVEVGAGKGDFIKRLLTKDPQATGYGFDPSYVGPEELFEGRLKFEKRFYDASCVNLKADIVVCRHVIEHIPQPLEIVQAVRQAVEANPGAHVFFETPCVDWILKNRVTWDFFYEHCSIFTPASLKTVFERAGFQVKSVRHVFNGQYQWLHAQPATSPVTMTKAPGQTVQYAREFRAIDSTRNRNWISFAREQTAGGKLVVWGAGAKAVSFAGLVDPDCETIAAIVDVNPSKQGKFLPGTRHPIVSPDALKTIQPKTVLVLNPNYRNEISTQLKSLQVNSRIVDMMNDVA